MQKDKILCGLIQEWESRNQFHWQKIGYNQVKYRWRKLTNPKQGLDRIYHCAKKQDPMWFGSEMRVWKWECVQTNEQTHKLTSDAGKNNSPTHVLRAGRGTNRESCGKPHGCVHGCEQTVWMYAGNNLQGLVNVLAYSELSHLDRTLILCATSLSTGPKIFTIHSLPLQWKIQMYKLRV